MKKYILYHNKVYEIKTNEEYVKSGCDNYYYIQTDPIVRMMFSKSDIEIYKQADTIEELCDEFIGINDNEHQFLRAIPYKCSNYWNNGVYGAIWTDKGLIYVAKLNNKGELELI